MRLVKEELKEFSAKGIKMRNTWITGLWWYCVIKGEIIIRKKANLTIRNHRKCTQILLGQSHCCTKPFTELKPIHLAQMKVPFVHEGHFLACRVLTESIVVFGLWIWN
jgi:hypothetical protein